MGVLQRFERRLEGLVGLAFARIFKGKVHPAEIAKALQREADEQRPSSARAGCWCPNVYVVQPRAAPTSSTSASGPTSSPPSSPTWCRSTSTTRATSSSDRGHRCASSATATCPPASSRSARTSPTRRRPHLAPRTSRWRRRIPPALHGDPGYGVLPPRSPPAARPSVAADTGKQGSARAVGRPRPAPASRASPRAGRRRRRHPARAHRRQQRHRPRHRGRHPAARHRRQPQARRRRPRRWDGAGADDLGSTNGTLVNGRRVSRLASPTATSSASATRCSSTGRTARDVSTRRPVAGPLRALPDRRPDLPVRLPAAAVAVHLRRVPRRAGATCSAAAPAGWRPCRPRGRRGQAEARPKGPAPLVVTAGPLTGTKITLGDQPILIGRADDSTLVLTDDFASSRHARLYQPWRTVVRRGPRFHQRHVPRPSKVTSSGPLGPAGQPIRIGQTVSGAALHDV